MSKNKKKNHIKQIDEELMYLALSSSFLSTALEVKNSDSLKIKKEEDETIKKLKLLLKDLSSKMKIFNRKLNEAISKAIKIFKIIENEAKKDKNKKFSIKVTFNKDGDVELNAELFALVLILEHWEMKNKIIQINHKLAQEIYEIYEKDLNLPHYKNSLALANKYIEIVKKGEKRWVF